MAAAQPKGHRSLLAAVAVLAALLLVSSCQRRCEAATDRLMVASVARTASFSHSSHDCELHAGITASMRHLHSLPAAAGLFGAARLAAAGGSGSGSDVFAAAARSLQQLPEMHAGLHGAMKAARELGDRQVF